MRPCSIINPNHYVNIARKRADEMNALNTKARGYFCDQFENYANSLAHVQSTGPEIFDQMNQDIDFFVMGAGISRS